MLCSTRYRTGGDDRRTSSALCHPEAVSPTHLRRLAFHLEDSDNVDHIASHGVAEGELRFAGELATTIIARLRGHGEVGLGTILGSNIFNGLWIVAIAAIIQPISVDWREVAVALVFGVLAVAVTLPNRDGVIERRRGVLLLILYLAYLTALLQQHR